MENYVPTLGARRVGLEFNPSGNKKIVDIKVAAADFIDLLESYKNDVASESYDTLTPEQFQSLKGEFLRAVSLSQTHIETASMYAVKSVILMNE